MVPKGKGVTTIIYRYRPGTILAPARMHGCTNSIAKAFELFTYFDANAMATIVVESKRWIIETIDHESRIQ